MEWHLHETKHLLPHETIRDTDKYFNRNTLMKRLLKCYNLEGMAPKQKRIILPHSKASVNIPWRDAKDCIVSLLTDPRIKDQDYLFYDNDPRAPPPEKVSYIADINTGDAFLKSYKKFITKPNSTLMGSDRSILRPAYYSFEDYLVNSQYRS